jgi:hypothetical protein
LGNIILGRKNLLMSSITLNLEEKLPELSLGSFDIGAKNLAVCIIDSNEQEGFRIHQWKLINLLSQVGRKKITCCKVIKNKKTGDRVCDKNASYWVEESNLGYCTQHAKMVRKEMDLEDKLVRYTTTKNISELELNLMIIQQLEQMPALWTRCHEVIIESQMRNGMKKIGHMIFCFLANKIAQTDSEDTITLKNIRHVSAGHKLAIDKCADKLPVAIRDELMTVYVDPECIKGKKNYDKRKSLSNLYCQILCRNSSFASFYSESKKKDDLADSLLQGLGFLLLKK